MASANAVLGELIKIKGATEMRLSVEAGNPEISVGVDRDKIGALRLNVTTVARSSAEYAIQNVT